MTKNKITKSTLLNIDSSFRNIKPKHIYNSNNFYLSPDPIEFIQNSNIITINYPNHDFVIGDNIIIQNVTGIIKILHNALYLVNNLKYVILNIENNEISINYTNYIDKLYTRIELVGKQNTPYFINNITFNSLIGIKVVFLANDILINDLVNKITNNEKIEIFDSEAIRPHLHVLDCAEFLSNLINADYNERIINIGINKFNITKRQLIKIIEKTLNIKLDILFYETEDSRSYFVDFSLLKRLNSRNCYNYERGVFDLYFKGGFMKDLNWLYMLDVLKGDKFTNIGLQQMAELNIGEVTGSKQYLKLTERLYTPTIMEKFAMK